MAAAAAAGLAEAPDAPRSAHARAARCRCVTETLREVQLPAPPALIIDKPLRSGQQVYARGGDLVVLAAGELWRRGDRRRQHPCLRAAARPRDRRRARRHRGAHLQHLHGGRSWCRSPASTAPTEAALPADVLGKPAQVRLDGEKLVVERWRLNASNRPTLGPSTSTAPADHPEKDLHPMAKIIVVTSGKGGVGKTTTSASFAVRPRAARPQDRGDRLRRRPAQSRPDHGLRAARGVRPRST